MATDQSSMDLPLSSGQDAAALLAALRAVSNVAAHAESGGEAMNGVLCVLRDAGLIAGGAVEVCGVPPVRCFLGNDKHLALIESLHADPEEGDEPPSADSAEAQARILVEPIPVQRAPAAHLYLLAEPPLDRGFVSAVAAQIALALDRSHLTEQAHALNRQAERRIREVATIYEIGRAMDMVEIGPLLQIITEKAAKVMDAQACSLMRLNPDANALTIAASYGLSEDIVTITQRAVGEGIAGRVAETGEPLLIADAHRDPRLLGVALRPDIGSAIVVPMKDEQGRVTGILSIRRRRPEPDFDQDDLRLFSVFASQATLAINNAELYADQRRRVNQLSTLSDLTQSVIFTLDLSHLLDKVADSIVEMVNFDRCCIFLFDRHTRRFVPRILRGYRPDTIGRNPVRIGEGVVGLVARKQMPIVEHDARNAIQPMRGFARALGTNAFVAIPIISKGQTIGAVVADNKPSGGQIREENVELLMTFVNQAGIAIENAQLSEDREQRYQEMNRLATQTDNILRSIAPSVVVVDAGGQVTRWNEASEELWGIPEERATALSYDQLADRFGLPPEEAQQLQALMQKARETGRPDHRYKLPLHPARRGEIHVNVLLSPLIDRQGERQGVVQIMEDVTREIRMEGEIGRIRRLADIGQLAAKMAHEVRNPLSSIKGAAQLMRKEYEELAPLREFLDIIVDEVNGLNRITTDLLDFARPMQLDLHATDLNNLAERTLQFMAAYLEGHRVAVTFTLDAEVPEIVGDPKQIEQVMRNVVINAAQAMTEGGELTVSTSYDAEQERVIVRFADTGAGISADKMEEIFQPFVTTKTKGTGLGLPIVRKIMENHGGQIEVASKVGEGTCFRLIFLMRPAVSDLPETVRILEPIVFASPLPDA